MPRPIQLVLWACLAVFASASLPATGQAVTTVGPAVGVPADGGTRCAYEPTGVVSTCSNQLAVGTSPVDGVVVRWRVQAATAPSAFFEGRFRILRRIENGFNFLSVGTSSASPSFTGVGEFSTRLPIKKDDRIGVDFPASYAGIGPCGNCIAYKNTLGTVDGWHPAVGDSPAGYPPNDYMDSTQLLLNADIEPDADNDGFGDESQDKCVGASGTDNGCVPSTSSNPPAPKASLSGSTTQDVLKQGAVIVVVTSDQAGSANATGSINAPGASKSFGLKAASSNLTAAKATKLKLKLSKKAKRAVRKSLKRRKKPKAKVSIVVKNNSGGASTLKRTVKIKGKKRKRH